MKSSMRNAAAAMAGLALFASSAGVGGGPLAPAHGIHEWVAGSGPGIADGAFDKAKFKALSGILYDASHDRLVAADQGASSLRIVDLSHANRVSTLALTGAGLLSPSALAWEEPDQRVAVLDAAQGRIVSVDLASGAAYAGLSPSASLDLAAWLHGATDAVTVPGGLLVCAHAQPALALLTRTAEGWALRRAWSVAGATDGSGLDRLTSENGQILAICHRIPFTDMAEIRDERNGYPGTRFTGPDADLPVTLTSQALNLGPLQQPWAFVRGAEPFSVITRSPYLAARIQPQQPACGIWRLGVYDHEDRLLGVQDNQLQDNDGNVKYIDPGTVLRMWLRQAAAAAADNATKTWYISDPVNGRIVSFRPIEGEQRSYRWNNDKGFYEWDFPVARRKEVKRIAVMNLSRLMMPTDTGRHSAAYARRLEHHLNMISALQGDPHGYEVYFVGGPFSWEADGMSGLGQLREKWGRMMSKVAPDELVLALGPMDLYQSILDYRMRPVMADGLPNEKFDPEFAVAPDESQLGPIYKDIRRYVLKHPDLGNGRWGVNSKGVLAANQGLEFGARACTDDPELFKMSFGLLKANLEDIAKRARKALPNGGGMPVTVLFYPDCNGISDEEGASVPPLANPDVLRGPLHDETAALHWGFIDIVSETRLFAAEDPFMINNNLHPNARGHNDLAFITAWRMLVDGNMPPAWRAGDKEEK